MRFPVRRNQGTENETDHVPSLYNNRAVDCSYREFNWRVNRVGLEETLLEIQAKSSNRGD